MSPVRESVEVPSQVMIDTWPKADVVMEDEEDAAIMEEINQLSKLDQKQVDFNVSQIEDTPVRESILLSPIASNE